MVRYYDTEKIPYRTVTVFLRGTKLRYGIFLEENSTENNFVTYRNNPLFLVYVYLTYIQQIILIPAL